MRKFSKILAVLLTVCVLCGVVASFAVSADDGDLTPTLGYATGLGTGSDVTIGGQSNAAYAGGINRDISAGYLHLTADMAKTLPTTYAISNHSAGLTLHGFYNGETSAWAPAGTTTTDNFGINTENFIEYATFDFDFGIDGYRYFFLDAEGNEVVTTDEAKIEGMTKVDAKASISADSYYAEPAMFDDFNIWLDTYVDGAKYFYVGKAWIVLGEDGKYYYANNTDLKSASYSYALASTVGAYDHFTYVYKIVDADTNPEDDNDEGATTKSTDPVKVYLYLYINGEYVTTLINGKDVSTNFGILRYYYAFTKADFVADAANTGYESFAWRDNYDVSFRNTATNFYTQEDLEKTTLDEFMEGNDYDTNFFGVTNIVANENYVTPNYKDGYVEYGGKSYYFTALGLAYAEETIKSGETITVSGISVSDFAPQGNVANFIVKLLNGASFASNSSFDRYAYAPGTDVYIINETNISGEGRLDVTGDVDNVTEDFTSMSLAVSENDGDQVIGLLHDSSNGYFRIYSNGGRAHYGGAALRALTITKAVNTLDSDRSNLIASSFTTVDFELGADRYVFTYTADVVRNQVTAGAPGVTDTTENLTSVTFYQYVESIEEFETYLADPSKLEGERTTTNQRGKNYTYTWNDTLSNVVINENSLTLAYGSGKGGDIGISTNIWVEKPTSTAKERVNTFDYKAYLVRDPKTNLWYLSDAKGAYSDANNNVLLSSEVGATNHVTIVYDNANLVDGSLSYIIYVNGQFLSTATMFKTATYPYVTLRGIGFLFDGTQKHITNFSLKMDDVAVNYYRSDVVYDNETTEDAYVGVESFAPYTSGSDVYGIDDLIADLKAETKNPCTKALDLYFNENLITKDGWVSIDGGLTVLTSPTKIAEALATMTDYGAELITSRKITISSLPEGVTGFYIRPVRGGGVTLAGELINTHVVADYMDGLLELRLLLDIEKLTVEFLDVNGSVYHTMILAPGVALEVPVYNYSRFNPSTGELVGFTKWVIEGTSENAAGYKYYGFVTEGKKLTVVPVIENQGRINTFALYTLDENGEASLIGTKDDYLSLSDVAIKSAIENLSVDGATLVLLYDGAFEIGGHTLITVAKNMSLDLNGRTLVNSKTTSTGVAYGNNLFSLENGVTFNLYSSKAGGAIYHARYPGAKYLSAGDAWGSGVFGVLGTSATLNVGAFDSNGAACEEYSGNLGIYGGTVIFVDKHSTTDPNFKTDFHVNLHGIDVYQATRSGYAAITARANGITISLKDSNFYANSNGSYYGAIYDYDYTTYYTKTYTTVDNCTFVALNGYADYNADKVRPLFNIGADSTLTMTNSTVYGSIGANEASLTLGEGNFIVGWGANLAKHPNMLGENISYGTLDAYAGTSFAHPKLYMMNNVGGYDTIIPDGANYVLNPVAYDKEQWVTSTVAYKGVIYTYASDAEAPVYSTAKVERYYGSKLKDTLDWVVGTEFGQIEVRTNHIYHYAGNYVWGYENGDSAMGKVISGDTVLKLIDFETGAVEIKDMQANLTLKTDMKFNLYIPAKPGVSITSVSVGTLLPNTFTYGGVEYFVIVIDLTAGNFDAIELTVGYSVFNDTYGDYTVEFEDVMTIDYVTSYASVAAKSAACGSETALLIKEIIDYNVAVAKYLDPTFDEAAVESIVAFREIYAAHNVADDPATEDVDESKSCVCDVALPETEATDLSGVADYVTDATFYLDSGMGTMGLILYVAEGYEGADLTVSFVDVNGNEVFADVEFIADKGYIVVSNIKAAYIANVMTITVGDIAATYSLATYIAETEDAAALAVANALLEYSVAAKAYKASVN